MYLRDLLKIMNPNTMIDLRAPTALNHNKIETVYRGLVQKCKMFNDSLIRQIYIFNDVMEIEVCA